MAPGRRPLGDEPALRSHLRDQAAEAAYGALATSPSRLKVATLEDALGVSERPNKPGTLTEWPNWSLALPLALEELERAPGPRRIARALARA